MTPAESTFAVAEASWRKSSYSSNEGGECVEVATVAGQAVFVRDSKDTSRPHLSIAPAGWADFVRYAAGS